MLLPSVSCRVCFFVSCTSKLAVSNAICVHAKLMNGTSASILHPHKTGEISLSLVMHNTSLYPEGISGTFINRKDNYIMEICSELKNETTVLKIIDS